MTLKVDCCFIVVVALFVGVVVVAAAVIVIIVVGFCSFVYTSCGELMFCFSEYYLLFLCTVHGICNGCNLKYVRVCNNKWEWVFQ